jgi:hypothetical protein
LKKFLFALGLLTMILALAACDQDTQSTQEQQKTSEQPQKEKAGEGTSTNSNQGNIASNSFFKPFEGKIDHVHGVGYVGNQNVPFFAAHDGLKVYENGKWYQTKKENNDYMGFNTTEKGFYSSGHPGADSKLPNPIGIKSSTDYGQTLNNITLEGETDFHSMGVGYSNNVIFVWNPEKNSLMKAGKYYRSDDGGETWKQVQAKGLNDKIMGLAVHPTDANVIAAAGEKGIYLSKDKGETFERIADNMQGTAVFFSKESLWYGGFNGTSLLVQRSLTNDTDKNITLPKVEQDAVLYFAQNPQNEQEMIFASYNGHIYQTTDGATNWNLLVKEGQLQ